jgi:hypothetical protein
MPLRLEGFIDDGRGEPLADIPAVATILGTSTVVDTTVTDDDGHWLFAGLPTADEYLVTLSDTSGNSVSRAPWSGEMRELWVRDRLDVAGLPVVLSPDPSNDLEWRANGFYVPSGLTTAAADLRYEPLDSAYTKAESDIRYEPFDSAYTKAEADARYEPIDTMYTKVESDARYPQKTDIDPYPQYLTPLEATGLYEPLDSAYTKAEADARYEPLDSAYTKAEDDARFVNLAGGSVMTGLLGPTTTNTRDLGTTALRWRKLWAVDGEFTNAPTVGGVALLTATSAGLLYEPLDSAYTKSEADARYEPIDTMYTKAEADARYEPLDSAYTKAEDDARFVNLAGGSVMTGLLGPSTHNTRDLGTTGTRWRALYGMTGDFTTSLTVATKPITPSPDAANIIEFRANGLYAAAGAVTDIWVNTTGDTMTGDLNMTANVLPTVTNTRDLGSTALRWLKVWAQDADFTNAPTVGGAALLTSTTADALFLTPTEGNAAYVGLAGGSVMTGLLGPTTTNTRDLGTTALRWRKLWAVDGEFTNVPTVGGVALPTVATADAAYVNVGGDTMTGILNINSPSADVLVLKGGAASDNTQLRFWGGASAVLQWAVGNNISTGGTGRLFQIYDAVSGASRLNIDSTGIVNALTALSVNSRPVIMAGCRVYHNAAQTITTATVTALAFNTERFDTDAFHDTVTNNTRLTVPVGQAGKYLIWTTVAWAPVADATLRLTAVRLGGTTLIGRAGGPNVNSATFATTQNVSVVYDLADGNYVEVVVRHERGSNLDVTLDANVSPEFGMQRIG